MRPYKVTVVIPVYNVEAYLERCLASAFHQTLEGVEYILVDDCSTDNSTAVAERYIDPYLREGNVQLIRNERNTGIGLARNRGIDLARGKYIFFLDSDDVIPPYALERLYAAAEQHQADVTVGSFDTVNFTNQKPPYAFSFRERLVRGNAPIATAYLNGDFYVYSWNKLYNTAFLRDNHIRCIPDVVHEDLYLSFQVALKAQALVMVPDVTYVYSIRPGSIMDQFNERSYRDHYLSIVAMEQLAVTQRNTALYPALIRYNFGLRHLLLLRLAADSRVPPSFRREYLKKFGSSGFSFTELMRLPCLKASNKVKYSLSFLHSRVQIPLLKGMIFLHNQATPQPQQVS